MDKYYFKPEKIIIILLTLVHQVNASLRSASAYLLLGYKIIINSSVNAETNF